MARAEGQRPCFLTTAMLSSSAGAEIQPTKDSAVSGGVHVQRKSVQDMQAAVSSKTFKCTQCGKCCSFLDDAEVGLEVNG